MPTRLSRLALGLLLVPALGSAPARAEETDDAQALLEMGRLLDTKVVSASRLLERAPLAPATIYVITEEAILRNGYAELKDALETVPGFTAIDPSFFLFGGQRGFMGSLSQTLLLVDGREMQNLIAAETFISHQFATHNIRRIEVIQGPGSALYGANALVGVINLITKSGSPGFEGTETHAELGSGATRAYGVVFAKSAGDWRFAGSLRASASDGYDFGRFVDDPARFADGYSDAQRGHIDATHRFLNKSAAVPVSLRLDWKGFRLGREAFVLDTRKGLERVALDYESLRDHRELELDYAGWQGTLGPRTDVDVEAQHWRERYWSAKNAFNASVYAQRYPNGGRISDADVQRYFSSYSSQENSSGSRRDRLEARFTHRFSAPASLVVGLVMDRRDVVGVASSTTDPSPPFDETLSDANPLHRPFYRTRTTSLYAQLKRGFLGDSLMLTLGERLDRESVYGSVWTARSGLVWRYSEQGSLKALFGQAFREPTIFEQGADAPGEPYNAGLKPARMTTYELGVHQVLGTRAALNLTAYRNLARELIVPVDTHHYRNGDGTRGVSGLEAQLAWGAGLPVYGDLGYAYTDAGASFYAGTWTRDLGVYRHQGSLGLNADLPFGATLNARAVHYGAVDARHGNPALLQVVHLPAATKVSLTLSSDHLDLGGVRVRWQATVRNAADAEVYQPNVRTGGPRQFLQPGREFLARVTLVF